MIETQKYVRKPLFVDAVRITSANFEEIATWCQGEILTDDAPQGQTARDYIKVRVHNPKNPRQTKAFVGDWLLYTERGYKVYTHKPFCASFDEAAGVIEKREFPYSDGDNLILGPECFVAKDGSVISWKGANYVPQDLLTRDQARERLKLPVDDSPAHAAAVEDVKARASAEDVEEGMEDRIEQNREVLARALNDDPSVAAEDAYVRDLADATAEKQAEDLRERVTEEETARAIERDAREAEMAGYSEAIPEPVDEMAKAQALIESEGGSVEEATPEGIASAVAVQENQQPEYPETHTIGGTPREEINVGEAPPTQDDILAEGKRVLSLEEQEKMDQTEVKELIQSGEAVLIQDLTVQQ